MKAVLFRQGREPRGAPIFKNLNIYRKTNLPSVFWKCSSYFIIVDVAPFIKLKSSFVRPRCLVFIFPFDVDPTGGEVGSDQGEATGRLSWRGNSESARRRASVLGASG